MRRCACCKLRLCSCFSTWWMKLLLLILVVGFFQTFRYYQSEVVSMKNRAVDQTLYYRWHCQLNHKMFTKLQKQLNEKNKLLNYRGKVIMTLRSQVLNLNNTNQHLSAALKNLTKTISSLNKELPRTNNSEKNKNENHNIRTIDNLSSFEELKQTAARASRPCCIALNRMTDILREHMESNQELREQVNDLRHVNFTQTYHDYENLYKIHENFTRKPEKYAVYQIYTKGFFYESIPLNRMDPKQKVRSKTFRRNYDFRYIAMFAKESVARKLKLNISMLIIQESIFRYDELKGAVYRFTFTYNNSRKITNDVVKPYGRPIASNLKDTKLNPSRYELINIIVPVSNRGIRLKSFLENILEIAKNYNENLYLTIVIYGNDPGNEIKRLVKEFSKKHNFKTYDILKRNTPFNRGRALHDGVMRWNGYPNVLLFLCDIDIKINPDFFHRCRQHTKLGVSVYMPIVFSLYNPNIVFRKNMSAAGTEAAFNISTSTGTWRPFGYGMVCLYKPDYLRIGGFNLKINGWGGEDYSLYIRILKNGINVIRAPDPALFHIWHSKTCSTALNIRQYETCLGSKARYEGPQRELGILWLSKNKTGANYLI